MKDQAIANDTTAMEHSGHDCITPAAAMATTRQRPRLTRHLTDPVCGMKVTRQSKHHVAHAGTDYFFCSAGCAAKFSTDPAKYLKPAPGAGGRAYAA